MMGQTLTAPSDSDSEAGPSEPSEPESSDSSDEYSNPPPEFSLTQGTRYTPRVMPPRSILLQYSTMQNPQNRRGLNVALTGTYSRRHNFTVHCQEPNGCPLLGTQDRPHFGFFPCVPRHPERPIWVYQCNLNGIAAFRCHCTFCLTANAAWTGNGTQQAFAFVCPPAFFWDRQETTIEPQWFIATILAWIGNYQQAPGLPPFWDTPPPPPNIGRRSIHPRRLVNTPGSQYLTFFHVSSASESAFQERRVYYLPCWTTRQNPE